MKSRILWLFLSCFMVLTIVAWSCDGTTPVNDEQGENEEEDAGEQEEDGEEPVGEQEEEEGEEEEEDEGPEIKDRLDDGSSASNLYKEFMADAETALTKYNTGGLIEISGEALEVWQSIIYLARFPGGGIECNFEPIKLEGIKVGDTVTVRGFVTGFTNGWVRMSNCTLKAE